MTWPAMDPGFRRGDVEGGGDGVPTAKAEDTAAFPWRDLMALGFGRLRLSSADFWAMTPRELSAAIEGVFGAGGAPPDRAMLDELMSRFPDRM